MFKSEEYLRELQVTLRPPNSVAEAQMRQLALAHSVSTGGIICGEVKLAITLRMLAGGSYLGLSLIFGTGSTTNLSFSLSDISCPLSCKNRKYNSSLR